MAAKTTFRHMAHRRTTTTQHTSQSAKHSEAENGDNDIIDDGENCFGLKAQK